MKSEEVYYLTDWTFTLGSQEESKYFCINEIILGRQDFNPEWRVLDFE